MSKAKYKAIATIEVQGFDQDEDGPVPCETSFTSEPGEAVLPLALAATLHGSLRRVDHLLDDGMWAHGAVGV